jgi:amphi-Trp domain-containing protein
MPKHEFKHESLQDSQSIASYLRALIEGFDAGQLTFSDEEESVTLKPRGLISFSLKAARRRDRANVSVAFSWTMEDEETDERGELHINGGGH